MAIAVGRSMQLYGTHMCRRTRISLGQTACRRSNASCAPRSALREQHCEPCESSQDATEYLGLSNMRMSREDAMQLALQIDPRWRIIEDDAGRLRIRRSLRTKNFVKALELFKRVGQVAEEEGHHPDLHLESYNNVCIELWTHARDGLSDNDFILAAKLDCLQLDDLLSKRQPDDAGIGSAANTRQAGHA